LLALAGLGRTVFDCWSVFKSSSFQVCAVPRCCGLATGAGVQKEEGGKTCSDVTTI